MEEISLSANYHHTKYFNGDIQTFDNVFTDIQLNEITQEVSSLNYGYGSIDDTTSIQNLQPAGMVNVGDGTSYWFTTLLDFCQKNMPEVKDIDVGRNHINLFGPRENARYHEDSPDGWTVLLYSNRYWDINEAGETKFILPVDLMNNEAIQSDTTDYPVILSIAPIPGRLVLFKGDLYHTATGFRSAWRFTPTIQFFNTGDQK